MDETKDFIKKQDTKNLLPLIDSTDDEISMLASLELSTRMNSSFELLCQEVH